MFTELTRDLHYTVRMFRRDPGFGTAAIAMLALGIGATVATFSVMDPILLKMLAVKDPASLFRTVGINCPADDPSGGGSSYKVFQQVRERTRPLADVMAYQAAEEQPISLAGASEERATHQIVSGNYFQVLGVQPAFGRLITPADDREPGQRPVAVISDRLWRQRFDGAESVLGTKIRIGDQMFQIVGVTPPQFFGVEIGKIVDVWTPISMAAPEYLRNEHFFWLHTMGRLHSGVTIAQAAAPMQAAIHEVMLEDVRQHAPSGTPQSVIDRFLSGMSIKGVPAGGGVGYLRQRYGQALQLLMALASMVLLIACTNVATLLLAKGTARRREIAIRLSLGAGRRRILQQLTTESVLLASAATLLGVLVARWIAPVFVRMLAPSTEPAQLVIALDTRLLALAGLMAVVTVMVSGLIPALHLAAANMPGSPKGGRRFAAEKSGLQRRLLVAAQIALSLVLVIGATLFSRTLVNLLSSQLGFEAEKVFTARLTLPRAGDEKTLFPGAWSELLERVRAMPGVEKASLTSAALFDGTPPLIGLRRNARQNAPADPTAVILFVSSDYFRTLTINVVEGQGFEDRDSQRNSPPIAIVNQTFGRKFFGQENPIGRELTKMADSPNWTKIAGVFKDAKFGSLRSPAPPILYVPHVQMANWMPPQAHPGFAMAVQVKGHQGLASFGAELRRETGARFTIGSISEQRQLIDDSIIRERLLSKVGRVFSLLSLALAALGLYGVMAYAVVQRRQEISVRMAVGAEPARILRLVLQESAGIILIGVAVGLVIAAGGTRMTKTLLYGLTPFDPAAFLTASCILLAATFVAALVPAYRASRIDSMITLRHD